MCRGLKKKYKYFVRVLGLLVMFELGINIGFYNNYYFVNILLTLWLVVIKTLILWVFPMATVNKQTGTTSFP